MANRVSPTRLFESPLAPPPADESPVAPAAFADAHADLEADADAAWAELGQATIRFGDFVGLTVVEAIAELVRLRRSSEVGTLIHEMFAQVEQELKLAASAAVFH